MGLLRRRPKFELDKKSEDSDSAFQALARLSLANDNDMLLERLMCVLPREPDQNWYSVKDAYRSKLWDIYPSCQIAGVCEDNSVIIDGAFGATIHWDRFRKVANARRQGSWKRFACQIALHGAPYALIWGILLLASSLNAKTLLGDLANGFNETNTTVTDLEDVLPRNFARHGHLTVPTFVSSVTAAAGNEFSKVTAALPTPSADLLSAVESVIPEVDDVISEIATLTAAVGSKFFEVAGLEFEFSEKIHHVEHSVRVAEYWAIFIEAVGIFLILIAGVIFISAPYLTRMLYRGKFCK
jgi:hypothetical protein